LSELTRELLRAKLLRYAHARFSGAIFHAVCAGLSGADPAHDEQWWLDNIDRRMKREGWNDKLQPHVPAMQNVVVQSDRWEDWLYEIWGPASSGRIARADALRRQEASLRKSEDWRARQASMGVRTGAGRRLAAAEGVFSAEALRRGRVELGLERDLDLARTEDDERLRDFSG
jgi:hypothetical protein